MLLYFNKFYKKFGLYKLVDFTIPKVLNIDTVVLPYYSSLFVYDVEKELPPTKDMFFLKHVKKTFLYNVTEFSNPLFPMAKKSGVTERSVINECKKHTDLKLYTKIKFNIFIKHKLKSIKYMIPVINYNYLTHSYRDLSTRTYYYQKIMNSLSTLVSDLQEFSTLTKDAEDDVNMLIMVEVPNAIYGYEIYHKYMLKETPDTEMISLFSNSNNLLLLELMKLFLPETRDKSIFLSLLKNRDASKKTTFAFYKGDKVTFVNFEYLVGFLKDIEFTPAGVSKINETSLTKLFIHFLATFLILPGFNPEDIDDNSYGDNVLTNLNLTYDSIDKYMTNVTNNKKDTEGAKPKKLTKKDIEELDEKSLIEHVTKKAMQNNATLIKDTTEVTTNDEKTDIGTVVNTTLNYENKYKDVKHIDELLEPKEQNPIKDTELNLKEQLENNKIDAKKYKKLNDIATNFLKEKSPFGGKETMADLMTYKEEDFTPIDEDLPVTKTLYNKKDAKDKTQAITKAYIKKVYKKDIVNSIAAFSKIGLIPKKIEVVKHADALGEYEEYHVDINDSGKSNYSLKIKIPTISDDGVFKISGNTYVLRKQKADLPIKKIAYNRVSLNTAYGKLFIDKAPMKKLDRGFSIKKELLKLEEAKKIKGLIFGEVKIADLKLPLGYALMTRYIKNFSIGKIDYNFNYEERESLLEGTKYKLKDIEKDKYILAGINEKTYPILVGFDDHVYEYKNGKYTDLGFYTTAYGLEDADLKEEYSLLYMHKQYIPIVYVLGYYMGLKKTLELLEIKYEIVEGRKKATEPNQYAIRYKYDTLLVTLDTDLKKMIGLGLTHYPKITKDVDILLFENKELYKTFYKDVGLKLTDATEIELIESLFIDPTSANILKKMKEPTTTIGLFIRASELLLDDTYMHATSMDGFSIKHYNRIPQFLYKAMVKEAITKKNEEFFGRSRLKLDPYAVWRSINEDSTSILVDDINPVAYNKQFEDITYLGAGGRNKDTLSRASRELHVTDIGVISESSKDNSDVGMSAYLSSNPKIEDARGLKDTKDKDLSYSNILSTSNMLAPFANKEDPKRALYTNIQNSHIIAIDGAKAFPVRTGYDSIFPYKLNKKFVGWALEEGEVVSVTKTKITVKYKTLGKKDYSIEPWTSKEESHTTYTHVLLSNVVAKQKVKKYDILYYDRGFFEPDMFDKTKVFYRANTIVNVAWHEIQETHEDAVMVSTRISKDTGINYVKIRDITLDKLDTIRNVAKIGQELDPNDPLFIISTDAVSDDSLDKETLDLLQAFIKAAPKAKYEGKLIKIKAFYNFNKSEASNSIKNIIDLSKPYMVDDVTGKEVEGKVSSGYSVNGVPLEEDKIHIKFYIEITNKLGAGDKCIIGSQLKSTITSVYDYPIVTDDGENIDVVFSLKGNLARMIRSADLMGTTATILNYVSKNAADIYFGDKS